jgi:putative transcriptional regulator
MAAAGPGAESPEHAIDIHLDDLLAARGMTLTQLSERVGVSIVNLSILKNGRAKAIRFSTLTRLGQALDCPYPGTWRHPHLPLRVASGHWPPAATGRTRPG